MKDSVPRSEIFPRAKPVEEQGYQTTLLSIRAIMHSVSIDHTALSMCRHVSIIIILIIIIRQNLIGVYESDFQTDTQFYILYAKLTES